MIIYILYKTVRTETGEYYIGIHGIDTDKYPRFNDPYLGSGNRLLASVKKYGKRAFKRSIISISESRKEAEALEAAMVTVEMIGDPLCLNLAPGGRGGVKGVPRSTATRQAISDALKGVPSPLKGIPKSAEHRQALSDAKKGVPGPKHSTETRQAISDAQKGSKRSVETRQAMSAAQKGVQKTPEHCQAISDGQRGRTHSVETRQAMSNARKGTKRSVETRQAMSNAKKGVPKSPEHRQAMSDAKKEYWRQRKLANVSTDLSEFTQ